MFTNAFYNQWPNLPAYFALGNRHWVSNFGSLTANDMVQHNIYPGGYPELTYQLAQGLGSPNHISQWNPLLIGIDLTQGQTTDPALIAAGQISAEKYGAQMASIVIYNSSLETLASIKAQIKNIKKSDKLDGLQKQRLQKIVDKIEVMEEKIKKAIASKNFDRETVFSIKSGVNDLIKDASKTAQKIIDDVKENRSSSADDDDDVDTDIDDEDYDDVDDFDDEDSDESVDYNKKAEEAVEKVTKDHEKAQNEKQNKAVEICQNIHAGSIGCTGTDYDKIKAGTNQITKDNVVTVLTTWQSQYQPSSGDANVIETLFDEEMMWNSGISGDPQPGQEIPNPDNNIDIIWNIVVALDKKAQELNVKNQLAGHFSTAYDELDDTCVDQSAVQNAVMTIVEALKTVEAEADAKNLKEKQEAAVKGVEDQMKADRKDKKDKKFQKQKDNFQNDMREILGDENAEVSENVKFKDGKFSIRINGKRYFGKNYNELAEALQDAGLEPAKYLKKPATTTAVAA